MESAALRQLKWRVEVEVGRAAVAGDDVGARGGVDHDRDGHAKWAAWLLQLKLQTSTATQWP